MRKGRKKLGEATRETTLDTSFSTPGYEGIFRRLLASERHYTDLLKLINAVFLESPRMPKISKKQRNIIFGRVAPLCHMHALLWRSLEPVLDESEKGNTTLELVYATCEAFYKISPFFTTYIPYGIYYNRGGQQELRDLLAQNSAFAQYAEESASLRPGLDIVALMALPNFRLLQYRRYFLKLLLTLPRLETTAHKNCIAYLRSLVRNISRIVGTVAREQRPLDVHWMKSIEKDVNWKKKPLRLLSGNDERVVLRKATVALVGASGDSKQHRLCVFSDGYLILAENWFSWYTYNEQDSFFMEDDYRIMTGAFNAAKGDALKYGIKVLITQGNARTPERSFKFLVPSELERSLWMTAFKEMGQSAEINAGLLPKIPMSRDARDEIVNGVDISQFRGMRAEDFTRRLQEMKQEYDAKMAIRVQSKQEKLAERCTEQLCAAFLEPPCYLATALCKAVPKLGPSDNIVSLARRRSVVLQLVDDMLRREIAQTDREQTLFRENTDATRTGVALMRQVGTAFLRKLLHEPVLDVMSRPEELELDPKRLPEGTSAEHNLQSFLEFMDKLIAGVTQSVEAVPPTLRKFLQIVKQLVKKKFPESAQKSVGAFYFLRFIAPAVVLPDKSGIIEETVSGQQRRALTLVSKVLQNIGNGISFSTKEKFLQPTNVLIEKHLDSVFDFFDRISDPTGLVTEEQYRTDEPAEDADDAETTPQLLLSLLNVVYSKGVKDKMAAHLKGPEKEEKWQSFLALLDTPVD